MTNTRCPTQNDGGCKRKDGEKIRDALKMLLAQSDDITPTASIQADLSQTRAKLRASRQR